MSTEIRKAGEADANAIADVFLAARATMTYLPHVHTDGEVRTFLSQIVRDNEAFVAEREGHVVGFALLRGEWLDHLYVHPARFNTHTGTKLFSEVKRARPGGFQFWVFQQNMGARRFYERNGCALAKLTDGHANEEKLPDALYVWPEQHAVAVTD